MNHSWTYKNLTTILISITLIACGSGGSSGSSGTAAPVVTPIVAPADSVAVVDGGRSFSTPSPIYYQTTGGSLSIFAPIGTANAFQQINLNSNESTTSALIAALSSQDPATQIISSRVEPSAILFQTNSTVFSVPIPGQTGSRLLDYGVSLANVGVTGQIVTLLQLNSGLNSLLATVNSVVVATGVPADVSTPAVMVDDTYFPKQDFTTPGCSAGETTSAISNGSYQATAYIGIGTNLGSVCVYDLSKLVMNNLTPTAQANSYVKYPISGFSLTNLNNTLFGYWLTNNGQIWRVTANSEITPTSFWQMNTSESQTSTATVNAKQSVTFSGSIPESSNVTSIYSDGNNNLYVGGANGYVYKLANGSTAWAETLIVTGIPVYVTRNTISTSGAIATSTTSAVYTVQ